MDPQERMAPADFAAKVKTKYPGVYDDVDDLELSRRIVSKYPDYAPHVHLPSFEDTYKEMNDTFTQKYGRGLDVTGNDTPQHRQGGKVGRAYDIRTKDLNSDQVDFLRNESGKRGFKMFDYSGQHGSRTLPSGMTITGPHLHIEYPEGIGSDSVAKPQVSAAEGAAGLAAPASPSPNPFVQQHSEIGITPVLNRVMKEAPKATSARRPVTGGTTQPNQLSTAALGLETAFNEARTEGDKASMERYGRMLQKEGWEAGPGEEGWWYVKPPSSAQRPASQGTEQFVASEQAHRAAPPRAHKRMFVPGVGDVGPVVEGAVDIAAGAAAPVARAAQGIYRAPGAIADEFRRIPMGTDPTAMPEQPTEPQVRPSYQSNPIEQGVGKMATSIEEFAQQHGLPVGIAKELANAAGGLAPLLLLKNPASIGGMTAAEAYGRGESLYDSLKAGAEQAAVIGTMGGGAKALDEALSTPGVYKLMREAGVAKDAARPAAIAGGGGARLAGRTAVNIAAPNVIRAATGQE